MAAAPGLIADIGGTNARFALVDSKGYHNEKTLNCADFDGPAQAVRAYLDLVRPANAPRRAAFAIAGPVTGDHFEAINFPWKFSIRQTGAELGLERFDLLNDFKAIAMAIPYLRPENLHQIGSGTPVPHAPIGIVGPGTGLGVASLIWDGQRYLPVPGEGGHVTMSAQTQREFDIFRTLHYKYRHVSAERVCSGKGLLNIYNAIRILDGRDDLPDRTPEDISAQALSGACEVCTETLDLMMGFLGMMAGNLALTLGAHGGIYVGGGIVQKLGEAFFTSRFRKQFVSKGRLAAYLDPIPTYAILHPYPAFVGLHAELMADPLPS